MADVLYIGGSGRSGSTIIQSLLGNLPFFQPIGEVQHIWKYLSWKNVKCSCEVLIQECPYWSSILNNLNIDEGQIIRLAGISKQINRTRNLFWLKYLYQDSNSSFTELRDCTEALYSSISKYSPERVILDTSKNPSHLLLLSMIPSITARVLHLVRDARAVAYSWESRLKRKTGLVGQDAYMDKRPLFNTVLRWEVENWYTDSWFRKKISYHLMRYEDFVENPKEEIQTALDRLGFSATSFELLPEKNEFPPTHGIGGNPVRFEKLPIRIEDQGEWRKQMPVVTQILLGILAAPLMTRYGYRIY